MDARLRSMTEKRKRASGEFAPQPLARPCSFQSRVSNFVLVIYILFLSDGPLSPTVMSFKGSQNLDSPPDRL